MGAGKGGTEKTREALESPFLLWIFESAIMVAAVPDHNRPFLKYDHGYAVRFSARSTL